MPEATVRTTRSGSQTRKKLHMVTTAYDDEGYAEILEAASRAGLTLASYQRVQSLASPKTRSTRRPNVDRELLAQVAYLLGKIGTNLNQVAKAANMNPGQAVDVAETINAVRQTLPLLYQAAGRDPRPKDEAA